MLKTVGNPSTRYGNQTIQDGNLVVSTSGKGVDFSATSHAPGMTSELFNDYEEGTWTPTVSSTVGALTSYTSSGTYTKIGRIVVLNFAITITNSGTASGALIISNPPFPSSGSLAVGSIVESAAVGFQGVGYFSAANTIVLFKYDWTFPGATGNQLRGTISYQV